jgi:hypothetical protein
VGINTENYEADMLKKLLNRQDIIKIHVAVLISFS